MTALTVVADSITIIPDDAEGATKVIVHYVNTATFSVRPGSHLKLVFERPVAFKVVQG